MTPDDIKGPARALAPADITAAAAVLKVSELHVRAVMAVESCGRGFHPETRKPLILFEPHLFSRLTHGKFDGSHPDISYPAWGEKPYPATQAQRWAQLASAMALDAGAALCSASWGLFQLLGRDYAGAGFDTAQAFALAMAQGEGAQVLAFARWVGSQPEMAHALRCSDWAGFARRYNGGLYTRNHYDLKLKAAFDRLKAEAAQAA